MTTIDKQSLEISSMATRMTKKSRTSPLLPAPPTPFSSPASGVSESTNISDARDDSMCVDNEMSATNVTAVVAPTGRRVEGKLDDNNSVKFAKVEIIELPYTLGDNPAVSSGAPISASWIAQKKTTLDLDFFEQYRPKRRNRRALQLSKDARMSMYVTCYQRRVHCFASAVEIGGEIDCFLIKYSFLLSGVWPTDLSIADTLQRKSWLPHLKLLASARDDTRRYINYVSSTKGW